MTTAKRPRTGRVLAFDAAVGTGVLRADDGTEMAFHATRISDGTRTVDRGAPVVFEVGPGPLPGTWEATAVVKVPS